MAEDHSIDDTPCASYAFSLSLFAFPPPLVGGWWLSTVVVFSFTPSFHADAILSSFQFPFPPACTRPRQQTFIKTVNYNHLMPTRYTLEVDLKATVTPDVLENSTKKVAARKEAKKVLEERFKTGKSRWFFTRLAF